MSSAAYDDGWNDALAGEELPPGASPAYASGWNDYHEHMNEMEEA